MLTIQVLGLRPHEHYACTTCKVFAESFMKTERAPPDVDTDKYIENLAVLVRLFVLCVWFDSLFTL